MFLKSFKFQILIVTLAYVVISSGSRAPPHSSQVCTRGLKSLEGAKNITCNVGNMKSYTCPFNGCHITVDKVNKDLSNYYFDQCHAPSSRNARRLEKLHPYDFHLSEDKNSLIVTSGWYFTPQSERQYTQDRYACIIMGSTVNNIFAHCEGCTAIKKP
ncbi:hypothetical protein O181_023964 [Austropuccinia psidii MF-1]|uniref:Secreted protein n=1 Tax=Austropuccinia psidii MF-1 TaxID=1389203 RepID=A0A9Q3CHQ2_9BASI|nr:hypothetical protein [Austropuccinia psidii MF-1]